MLQNPFKTMSLEELQLYAKDILESKENHTRANTLVPYAKEIMQNLNLENPTISLRKCLQIAKEDFYIELCERFIHIKETEEMQELAAFREKEKPKKVIVKDWEPDTCPICKKELSTHLGDGYYTHPTFLKRCPNCLQVLSWKDD